MISPRCCSLQGLLNTSVSQDLPLVHDLTTQLSPTTSAALTFCFCEATGYFLQKQLLSPVSKVIYRLCVKHLNTRNLPVGSVFDPGTCAWLLLPRQLATLPHTEHALWKTPTLYSTFKTESLIWNSILCHLYKVFLVRLIEVSVLNTLCHLHLKCVPVALETYSQECRLPILQLSPVTGYGGGWKSRVRLQRLLVLPCQKEHRESFLCPTDWKRKQDA